MAYSLRVLRPSLLACAVAIAIAPACDPGDDEPMASDSMIGASESTTTGPSTDPSTDPTGSSTAPTTDPTTDSTTTDSTTTDSTTTDSTTTDSTTTDPTGSSSSDSSDPTTDTTTGEPVADGHGFVCLDLVEDVSATPGILEQTHKIRLRLHYTHCLRDFYLNTNPEYRLDNPLGEAAVLDWLPLLCAAMSDPIACSVASPDSFVQTLVDDINAYYHLAIEYVVEDPSTTAGRLLFGPLPLEELTDCGPGEYPSVTIDAPMDGLGYDENDEVLWEIAKFTNTPNKSRVNEGSCIELSVTDN